MLDALTIACVAAGVIMLTIRATKQDRAGQASLGAPVRAPKPRWAYTFRRKPRNEAEL